MRGRVQFGSQQRATVRLRGGACAFDLVLLLLITRANAQNSEISCGNKGTRGFCQCSLRTRSCLMSCSSAPMTISRSGFGGTRASHRHMAALSATQVLSLVFICHEALKNRHRMADELLRRQQGPPLCLDARQRRCEPNPLA